MAASDDTLRIILGASALSRLAALDAHADAPVAQWRTLRLLRDHGPQRTGALARLSRVSQPGMTRLIGQMIEAGLVERTTDPDDARAGILHPTAAGIAALDRWLSQLRGALQPRLTELDAADEAALAHVAALLERLGEPRRADSTEATR